MKTFILLLMFLSACSDEQDRFETITKLRTIGVSINPPITTFTKDIATPNKVALQAEVALPPGQEITVDDFQDALSTYAQSLTATVDENSIDRQDLGPLRFITFNAQVEIPRQQDIRIQDFNGIYRLRFGLLATSGSEEERIVGDIVVVPEGHEALTWVGKGPDINLESPGKGEVFSSGEKIPLNLTITKNLDEVVKVVWFVSSGKVKNINAPTTYLEEVTSGEQTVVVAVYPRESRDFKRVIRTFVVN